MSHVMHHFMSVVECEKNELQEKVKTLHVEEEACRCLQQRIQQLEGQISETQLRLDKESAKYHSACRQQEVSVTTNTELFVVFGWRTSPSHPRCLFLLLLLLLSCVQSMHAKQKSLLQRVDALDEECEELQRQLGEREERQADLHNQLKLTSQEKEQVQAQLAQQQVYLIFS